MTDATFPPGPKGTFFGGNLDELRRDALGLYTRCARDFGDVSTMRFGLRRLYLINHPELIESVLLTNSRNWVKHYALRMNRMLLGDGLLTSEGDFWLRQRRLIQPVFHRDRLAGYGTVMVELTERLVASWREGETRDLHADMTQLTLEIIARAMFGAGLSEKGPRNRRCSGRCGQVVQSPSRQLPSPAGKPADAGQSSHAPGGGPPGCDPVRPHQTAARVRRPGRLAVYSPACSS